MLTAPGGQAAAAVLRQPTLRESVAAFQQRLKGPPNTQRQFALCVLSLPAPPELSANTRRLFVGRCRWLQRAVASTSCSCSR